MNINSIDEQLSQVTLDEKPQPGPLSVKKKRPARAYHVLSPPLGQTSQTPEPASIADRSGLGHELEKQQYGLFSPILNSFRNSLEASFSSTQSVPYGNHSIPTSPFSPPGPTAMQFQYQSEVQNGMRSNQRAVLKDVTSNIPEPSSLEPYNPESTLSVAEQRGHSEREFLNRQFLTFQNACPPCATTQFRVVDQGTALPKFMTLSMYNLPSTESLRAQTGLPVAVNVRPFAPVEDDGDEPVPEVDLNFISSGPPRCNRCKAYVNATVQFTRSNKFICNLCQFANPVPEEYYSPLDQEFRRADHQQRPELNKGVVDFLLPEAYWEKDRLAPVPLHVVFLVDVSLQATQKDLPRITCEAIRAAVYDGELSVLPPGSQIAIVTFDKYVQFYNLSPELQQPQVCVMTDIEEPFVPFHRGLFVDPVAARDMVEATLATIEAADKFTRYSEVSFGAGLNAAFMAIYEVTQGQGGKVCATLATIPNYGAGTLSFNKNENVTGHSKEKAVYTGNNQFFRDLADAFCKENIGLDMFLFPSLEMDLMNSARVSLASGGSVKMYSNFNPLEDDVKYIFDFKKAIGDTVGYQGHVKVRCSSGLQVKQYYSAGRVPDLASVHKNTNFDVLFSYDSKLNTKLDCHFQAAVLYTSILGVRKVRVINLVAAVSDRIVDAFSFVNQDVLLNLVVRDCVQHVPDQTLVSIKQSLDLKISTIFSRYRQHIVKKQALGSQFVIPEGLRTLTSYILSFEKSKFLRPVTSGQTNARLYNRYLLTSLPLPLLSYYLYPLIIPVHDLEDDDGTFNEVYKKFQLPVGVAASLSSIVNGGCYLTFNGVAVSLWIHSDANELLLKDLFGVAALRHVMQYLPELDTEISTKVRAIVAYLNREVLKLESDSVRIIRFGIDDQLDFMELFVEDESVDRVPSYSEYLSRVHKDVREMTEEKNKASNFSINLVIGGAR